MEEENTVNLEGRVAEVLPRINSPAGKRVLEFVVTHQGRGHMKSLVNAPVQMCLTL